MADISKITLPSGNTYNLKDAYARELLAGGLHFVVCWDGTSAPVVANIPTGVKVTYNGTAYTGTKAASTAEPLTFYLVKSPTQVDDSDHYDEYVAIDADGGTKAWEKLGDTRLDLSDLGELAYMDNVTLKKGAGDNVLGEATTFTNSSSAVSFSGGTTDKVLGSDATFKTTVTPTTTNIKATASGTAVGANGTAAAITGFGAHSTETFVKSVTAETGNKLVTTSITPTNGTETVSKVTKTASKLVTTTVPNVTSNVNKSWKMAMGAGADSETLIFSGDFTANNEYSASITELGTAKTVATGAVASNGTGSDIVTAVSVSDKTVAKVGTAVTVATGSVASTGTGSPVVTGVSIGESAEAITALGTPTTSTVLTGVKVTSQPTIALATGATAGTGVISVATGITSATTTTNNKDEVTAVTGVGTATAAAQTITVGTNDKVKVAKYEDLSVSVSKDK